MPPFPAVDELELAETHAFVERPALGGRAVLLELGLPAGLRKRRERARDGPPFRYGEAGPGEASRASDRDHQGDEEGEPVEPGAHAPGRPARRSDPPRKVPCPDLRDRHAVLRPLRSGLAACGGARPNP